MLITLTSPALGKTFDVSYDADTNPLISSSTASQSSCRIFMHSGESMPAWPEIWLQKETTMTIRSLPIIISATTITPQATVLEALQIMIANRSNHVPVCDGERYVGVISVNDILQKLLPAGVDVPHGVTDLKFAGDASRLLGSHFRHLSEQRAQDILHHAQPLDENCPLLEAALLLSHSPTPLPVVDHAGKLLGMLSRRGLLEYLAKEVEK